jgi:DNA topoisomerase-1
VWISPDPHGHIQAVARDARGRRQYRYHERWKAARDEAKFDRMVAFSRSLPRIRRRVARDLRRPDLCKERVVAAVVQLLERTWVRVGNERYARTNHSYGLTTLRDRHVSVGKRCLSLQFRAKGNKLHRCEICDDRLTRVVARCKNLPGEELFQYVDARGRRRSIRSSDVNDYLRAITGEEFSAKDFRTWSGTMLAAAALLGRPRRRRSDRKRAVLAAIDQVAEQLDNTRAVCRRYYVHPHLLEEFEHGTLERALRPSRARGRPAGLSPGERSLANVLSAPRRSR